MQRCNDTVSAVRTPGCAGSGLPARSAGSAISERSATDVTANHAIAGRSKSSMEGLAWGGRTHGAQLGNLRNHEDEN